MAVAPDFLTWTGDGGENTPRRPSTDDLGGDDKQDDAEYPPDDVQMPTAAAWNQLVKQAAALAQCVPACVLEVRFSGGAPFIARVTSPNPAIVAATFDVTDEGTGDTTIEWDANTFPPAPVSPSGLTVLSDTTTAVSAVVEEVANGIRVRTMDDGSPADLAFTIHLN